MSARRDRAGLARRCAALLAYLLLLVLGLFGLVFDFTNHLWLTISFSLLALLALVLAVGNAERRRRTARHERDEERRRRRETLMTS